MKSKKKLHIVYLIWNTKKCGGNKLVFEFANRLIEKKYPVRILSFCGGCVDWFNLKTKVGSFFRLGWVIKKSDILVATFWPTAYLSLLISAGKRVYLVLGWEPDYYSNPLLSFLARLTYKLPFKFITISSFLREKIIGERLKEKVLVIPPSINTKVFRPKNFTKTTQQKRRILSVISSYQLYKGLDNLVWLIRILKEKYPNRFYFVLVSFEKESYSSVFDEFISNATRHRLVEEYQKADVFLSTSRTEGFFLPGLEAMACGCPVVMTDSGGIRDYARNGDNCLLAKNYKGIIRNGLLEKVLTDSSLRKKLFLNGLETSKIFSLKETIYKLEEYFSKIKP